MPGESSEHKPDAAQTNKGDDGSVEVFVALGEAARLIQRRLYLAV